MTEGTRTDELVGRCVGCFHDFTAGPCGGCGAVRDHEGAVMPTIAKPPRCVATIAGWNRRCRRLVDNVGDRCWQHREAPRPRQHTTTCPTCRGSGHIDPTEVVERFCNDMDELRRLGLLGIFREQNRPLLRRLRTALGDA